MSKLSNIWKNRVVTVLGFLVLIIPMTGFPQGWKDAFCFIFGIIIVALSFQLGRFIVYGNEQERETESDSDKRSA